MNRVVENLEARRVAKKRPLLPRLSDDHPYFDVGELAEEAVTLQIPQRQHPGTESQLEVERRGQVTIATDPEDRARLIEVFPHGLLNQHGGSRRYAAQHAGDLITGHGEIEDGVRRCARFREASEDRGHA